MQGEGGAAGIQKGRSLGSNPTKRNHVSQSSGLSVEEEEEFSKVPSSLSIAQRPTCKCDNCSDKALGYWQFAEVLVDDGEEVRTRNLCQQCCNEERKEQVLGMESFGGTDSATPQTLEKCGKSADFARNVGLFIG